MEELVGSEILADLSSAVGQPLNDYFYGQADLFAIAAAYAFHIAQAQAFLDGNQRTAITAALSFSSKTVFRRRPRRPCSTTR